MIAETTAGLVLRRSFRKMLDLVPLASRVSLVPHNLIQFPNLKPEVEAIRPASQHRVTLTCNFPPVALWQPPKSYPFLVPMTHGETQLLKSGYLPPSLPGRPSLSDLSPPDARQIPSVERRFIDNYISYIPIFVSPCTGPATFAVTAHAGRESCNAAVPTSRSQEQWSLT